MDDMDNNYKDHKDLDVWKASIDLVVNIYSITKLFPNDELYGLTNQLRRAAVSIPSNISEGAARKSSKEFIQFSYIALGSLSELETQLIIAEKLNYIGNNDVLFNEIISIKKMIHGLIRYLRNTDKSIKRVKNDK